MPTLAAVRRWRAVCAVCALVGAALALSACSGGSDLPVTVTGRPVFGFISATSCSLTGTTVTASGTFHANDPAVLGVTLKVFDTGGRVIGSNVVNGGKVWPAGTTWDWTVRTTVGSATPTSCEVSPGGGPIGGQGGITGGT